MALAKVKTVIEPVLIDIQTVTEVTGLSKSTVQKMIRENDFPKPRKASPQRTGWLLREIKEWAENRPIADFLPPSNTSKGGKNGKPC